jgi:hypothetical protein
VANICSMMRPADMSSAFWSANTCNVSGSGIANPQCLKDAMNTAGSTVGRAFNADQYNISCVSFPPPASNGDPLISQAAQIAALSASAAQAADDINTIESFTGVDGGAAAQWAPEDHLQMFGLVVGVLVLVWVGKYVLGFFWRQGGDHA